MHTVFNCTMCSAPLDPTQAAGATMRCNYCGNTIIVPEEFRGVRSNNSSGAPAGESFVPMIDQALKLAEISRLVKSGHKIEAIKLYRAMFGIGLKEAKDAVEQMETGQPVVFTQANYQGANASAQGFPQAFDAKSFIPGQALKKPKTTAGCWILLLVLLPLAGVGIGLFMTFRSVSNIHVPTMPDPVGKTATVSSGSTFADVTLEFGSEGIGPKQFKDARSVAVDGQGRIYVAEYSSSGRIQVFDSNGNFITQWMVDARKVVKNIAADRKGTVYVVHPGSILRYDGATGNLLGEVAKPGQNRSEFYSDACVALDGSLYTIGSNSNILHIGADGEVKNTIKVAEKVGSSVDLDKLAVDGVGNIYAIEGREDSVYKFAPDGRYISKFGGKGREPGQLDVPLNIAVDGQGRVYVSAAGRGVQVFDANGRYIDSFGGTSVIFGIAVTDRNEIVAAERNKHQIARFTLKK